jgi:hypothetical protein
MGAWVWGGLWRAWLDGLRVRVLALSLLPFFLMVVLAGVLIIGFWEPAQLLVRDALSAWGLLRPLLDWLSAHGMEGLRAMIAPMVLVFLATPVVASLAMVLVVSFMPAVLVPWVAARRFPALARQPAAGFWWGAVRALGMAALAAVLVLLSIPLWLIPPLGVLIPALIWGWLTYQVMWFDALAEYASAQERSELARRHRPWLWGMGMACGLMGGLPSLVWTSWPALLIFAPLLASLAIWIYVWLCSFALLWFTHVGLQALHAHRQGQASVLEAQQPPAAVAGASEGASP